MANKAKQKKHHMVGRANARLGETNRSKAIILRCTEDEHAAIMAAAENEANGVMSEYIRSYVPAFENTKSM